MKQFEYIGNRGFNLGVIFRGISIISFILTPCALLFNMGKAKKLLISIVLPITIISMFFAPQYIAFAKANIFNQISFYLLNAYSVLIMGYIIYRTEDKKSLIINFKTIPLFLVAIILTIPLNIFMPFAKHNNPVFIYRQFSLWYFVFLLLFILAAILLNHFLKGKRKEQIRKILFILSLSMLLHLFERFSFVKTRPYQDIENVIGAMPFYVCSFGTLLFPFIIYFDNDIAKKLLFLINTPGAIIVFVKPTMNNVSIFDYDVTYFILNHILLFSAGLQLPYLFDKKMTFKMIKHLTTGLLIYFMAIFIINTIFANVCTYDPNFSFVAKSPIDAKFIYKIGFHIGKTNLYPIYLIILILVHISMSVLTLLIYQLILKHKEEKQCPKLS